MPENSDRSDWLSQQLEAMVRRAEDDGLTPDDVIQVGPSPTKPIPEDRLDIDPPSEDPLTPEDWLEDS